MGNKTGKDGDDYDKQNPNKSDELLEIEEHHLRDYGQQNIIVLIAYYHYDIYTRIENFISYLKSKPGNTIITEYRMNLLQDRFIEEENNFIIKYDLTDIESLRLVSTHMPLLISSLQGKMIINVQFDNLLETLKRVNLYARHIDDAKLLNMKKKFRERDIHLSQVFLLSFTLWCFYPTLQDIYDLNTIEITNLDRNEWRADNKLIFMDHRLGVVLLVIGKLLIHRDLYTLEIAENKLQDLFYKQKEHNKKNKQPVYNRHNLFRLCFDEPGHFQVLIINDNTLVINVNNYYSTGNDDEITPLSNMVKEHAEFITFFIAPYKPVSVKLIQTMLLQQQQTIVEDNEYCITCQSEDPLYYEKLDSNAIFCNNICQAIYHENMSFLPTKSEKHLTNWLINDLQYHQLKIQFLESAGFDKSEEDESHNNIITKSIPISEMTKDIYSNLSFHQKWCYINDITL
jgi:hypothetical protein